MSHIDLSHGAGGRSFHKLLTELILPALGAEKNTLNDGAILERSPSRLVMTTDAHVVSPLLFPGGDIGHLAFCGTVNDLAMMGARPLALTLSLILEEGLPLEVLERALSSMGELAKKFQVPVVAGDTKVVERGKGDGIYLSVAGVGAMVNEFVDLGPHCIREGSAIIVSGTLGDHGVAIMSHREGLSFETQVVSDCAPLHETTHSLLNVFPDIQCLRDPTRGGLAAVLNELSHDSKFGVEIDEAKLPVSQGVRSACELLGLDPLQIANEGKFVLVAPANRSEEILKKLRTLAHGESAQIIGHFKFEERPKVSLKTVLGGQRLVTWPEGEQLPRIC